MSQSFMLGIKGSLINFRLSFRQRSCFGLYPKYSGPQHFYDLNLSPLLFPLYLFYYIVCSSQIRVNNSSYISLSFVCSSV